MEEEPVTDYLVGAVWISAAFCLCAVSLWVRGRRPGKRSMPWRKVYLCQNPDGTDNPIRSRTRALHYAQRAEMDGTRLQGKDEIIPKEIV